jgi:hypothetical protein
MPGEEVSCTAKARGPIVAAPADNSAGSTPAPLKEVHKMTARVGKPAPDFEAMGYQNGSFKRITLSEFKGHWVLVCFYPGDFTFV